MSHTYTTTTSNIAQVVNAFDTSDIFNGVDAFELRAYANSANVSATLRASVVKRSSTAYDIYISESTTTDETKIAGPSLEHNAVDDTIDILQVAASVDDGSTDWLIVLSPDQTVPATANEVCTTTDVFEFAGTESNLRTSALITMVEGVIARVVDEIEKYINRLIIPTLKTVSIHDTRFCSIVNNKIYLNDIYYDCYSISSLTEDGTALTENTDFVVTTPNVLEKLDATWSTESLGIAITGYFGMGYESGGSYYPHQAMKQIVIEAVAVKAGLWSRLVSDGEGNNFEMVSRSLPKFTYDELKRFVQPVVI